MAAFDHVPHGPVTGHVLSFASAIFNRAADFVVAIRNRRQVARLLNWDGHMLRDIGLTPGDVHSAMAGPLHEDPSYRLDTLAQERRHAAHALARERLRRGRR